MILLTTILERLKVKKTEPEDVLLITRIHIDKHGKKKSVAVAVLPPPPGEEFEGGYKIERNPINGAMKLIEPNRGIKRIVIVIR